MDVLPFELLFLSVCFDVQRYLFLFDAPVGHYPLNQNKLLICRNSAISCDDLVSLKVVKSFSTGNEPTNLTKNSSLWITGYKNVCNSHPELRMHNAVIVDFLMAFS